MIRMWLISAVALVLFGFLGALVSGAAPAPVDATIARLAAGRAPALALLLTKSGLLTFLLPACAGLIAAAVAVPAWRERLIFAVTAVSLTHVASDMAKPLFKRERPPDWIAIHETSYGYPSGHAATATVFLALLAYFVWRSNLPVKPRAVLAAVLALWAAGICWSRLALGAHYPTDLVGGFLLGTAVVAFMRALCGLLGVELEASHRAGGLSPASAQENAPR